MAVGLFAEIIEGKLTPSIASLVEFGKKVTDVSKEELVIFAAGQGVKDNEEALKAKGVDKLVLMDIPSVCYVQTDALSEAIAQIVDEIDFSTILVPATKTARALFARVAMKNNIGMTADCSDLDPDNSTGEVVVHQLKPSFGAQIMVSCDVIGKPEIVTMKVDEEAVLELDGSPAVQYLEYNGPESAIKVAGVEDIDNTGSIHSAEVVVCAGRGAMEEDNFELVKQFAEKIGAAVAGSRPMADNGWIPFANQVGQSGTVIRPKVAIIFGVSGAIQFTEGIKGDPLVIAVNKDQWAPIFGFANYGVVADMREVLTELLK